MKYLVISQPELAQYPEGVPRLDVSIEELDEEILLGTLARSKNQILPCQFAFLIHRMKLRQRTRFPILQTL